MSASDLFKAGKLQEAIEASLQEVKSAPADQGKRIFLFELLAFAGDLERAKRQIDAVQYNEVERDHAVLGYRKCLDAEQARRRLFSEGTLPQFLVEPPEHVRMRIAAVQRLREKLPAEAAKALAQAEEATNPVKGVLNDKPFESLRDCDDVFGPVLEVFAHGAYYWVPLEQIDTLTMNPPKFPRDLIWFPAKLAIKDGPAGDVFLPALYPGSHEHADNQIKLGRLTDWKQMEGGPVQGIGSRTFLVGEDAIGLLEWRTLQVG